MLHHLRAPAAGVDVVVDRSHGGPAILHWGSSIEPGDLEALRAATDQPVPGGSLDVVAPVSLVPEHGSGFAGRPGLRGHRLRGPGQDLPGSGWAARFSPRDFRLDGSTLVTTTADDHAGLDLVTTVELDPSGVLRARAAVWNSGDTPYAVDALTVTLPLPAQVTELLAFDGRWCRELHPRRTPWGGGAVSQENRRGRTSHDHLPLLWAGTPGFGEHDGEVFGVHLAWSGNSVLLAEALADGRRYLQLGELLHPGEVVLDPGESYTTPWVHAAASTAGLTPASQAFHRFLRGRPSHPRSDRPVLLNTWEAVYFDHDLGRLTALAGAAAAVGVERFVLDDGWFGGRRNDRAGLGDWNVSAQAHPDGLAPLVDHVRGRGMEFGIWVEPEMVNPDSELFRAHPDWALRTPGHTQVLGRHQLVLDLTRREAFSHVHAALDALLRDHDIDFVKWDMNRDHAGAGDQHGRPATHRQTAAVYELLDRLRADHPGVEIESCASGGGRMDHGVLERTDRVWTSDCNDPLERSTIQRWASTFLPPELLGAHIGPGRAHTTGRRTRLAFRAAVALFGHLGLELDLLDIDERERAGVAEVIALHKRFRPLLHTGDVVRLDPVDPSGHAHGVVGADRSEALFSYVQLTTAPSLVPPPLRPRGLDPDRTYRATHVRLPGERWGPATHQPAWLAEGVTVSGKALAAVGLQLPVLDPASALLVHLLADT